MLSVYNNFFKELHNKNIIFCNWKDHHAVNNYLNGDGDLDLFVPIRFKKNFDEIAKNEGFRRVISFQSNHDYIEHYYGLDQVTLKFVHIHVYFKIITGEHASKNYDLPLENYILINLDRSSILPKINVVGQHTIFLIRYFLKIGSIYGIFQYWRDIKKYSNEWNSFEKNFDYDDILDLGIFKSELKYLDKIYTSSFLLKKFFLSIKFKEKLKLFRRRPYLQYQKFIIQDLGIRIFNKLILKKKKTLKPGIVIAICGLDGSGKSSLVSALKLNFSKHFSTKVFHLGRPKSNTLTFLFNIVVKFSSFLKRFKNIQKRTHTSILSKKISYIYLIRSVLLAYDRKIQSDKAFKYSKNGYMVICDRYPGLENGKMDSPRIPADKLKGSIYQFFYKTEQKLYKSIIKARFIFQLTVPLEIAIKRNSLRKKFGKETDDELRERYNLNSGAKFIGENYYNIDASKSFETVLEDFTKKIWYSKYWN
jgi:thymidylate kinase